MTRQSKPHAATRKPLVPPDEGLSSVWEDVPDSVIVGLVRAYASEGDAILFGTSQDRAVCAIRVYRDGSPYSVYFRKLADLETAPERLGRYRPARHKPLPISPIAEPQEQVSTTPRQKTATLDDVYNHPDVVASKDTPEGPLIFARTRVKLLGK